MFDLSLAPIVHQERERDLTADLRGRGCWPRSPTETALDPVRHRPAAAAATGAATRAVRPGGRRVSMPHDVISTCPVCSSELAVTRLHCRSCGTTLEGDFSVGRFGRLTREQLTLLESFLRSRGNLREMERELGDQLPHRPVPRRGARPGPRLRAPGRRRRGRRPATEPGPGPDAARRSSSPRPPRDERRGRRRRDPRAREDRTMTAPHRTRPRARHRCRRPAVRSASATVDVRVRAIDGDTVRVRDGAAGTSSDMFTIDLRRGQPLAAATARGTGRIVVAGHTAELESRSRAGAPIIIEAASGDIEVDGLLGDQRYRTASGDILSGGQRPARGRGCVGRRRHPRRPARPPSRQDRLRRHRAARRRPSDRCGSPPPAATSRSPAGSPGRDRSPSRPSAATRSWRRRRRPGRDDDAVGRPPLRGRRPDRRPPRPSDARRSASARPLVTLPLHVRRPQGRPPMAVRLTPGPPLRSCPRTSPRHPRREPPPAERQNGAIAAAYEDARFRILRSLERGEIDVAEAGRRLEALDGVDPLRHDATSRPPSRPATPDVADTHRAVPTTRTPDRCLTRRSSGSSGSWPKGDSPPRRLARSIDALDERGGSGPSARAVRPRPIGTTSRPGRRTGAGRDPRASRSPRRPDCRQPAHPAVPGPRRAQPGARASPTRPRTGSARPSRPASRAPSSTSTTPATGSGSRSNDRPGRVARPIARARACRSWRRSRSATTAWSGSARASPCSATSSTPSPSRGSSWA